MEFIRKAIAVPFTILFFFCFFFTLTVFHVFQWTAINVFGAKAHKIVVDYMAKGLLWCHLVLGNIFSYKNQYTLPKDRPLIIVSNHQSMFDIPLILWYMRKHTTKFISKIELGKGIPSISYNLRHGGNALIDRKNPNQSIPELARFGKYIKENNFAAVIFPEGTRSRTGKPKKFATTGLKILFKHIPDAVVVPVTINNSWKLLQYGNFPMGIGIRCTLEVKEPIELAGADQDELIATLEEQVTSTIK